MFSVSLSYKQDPDTVFRFLTDPANVKARCEAMGERDVAVTNQDDTVTCVRVVEASVPSFAKKLLKPTNTVTDVKRWSRASRKATFSVDIKGVPVTIEGAIELAPSGSGATCSVTGTVTCRIPLIGGTLAKHVAALTEQGLRKEWEWNQQALDRA